MSQCVSSEEQEMTTLTVLCGEGSTLGFGREKTTCVNASGRAGIADRPQQKGNDLSGLTGASWHSQTLPA